MRREKKSRKSLDNTCLLTLPIIVADRHPGQIEALHLIEIDKHDRRKAEENVENSADLSEATEKAQRKHRQTEQVMNGQV